MMTSKIIRRLVLSFPQKRSPFTSYCLLNQQKTFSCIRSNYWENFKHSKNSTVTKFKWEVNSNQHPGSICRVQSSRQIYLAPTVRELSSDLRTFVTIAKSGPKRIFKTQCVKDILSVRHYSVTASQKPKDLKSLKTKDPKVYTVKDVNAKEIKAKVRGIQKDISPLTTRRIVRRKKTKDSITRDQAVYDVMAYATSEEINLDDLQEDLIKQGLYEPRKLPDDVEDVLYAKAKYRVDDVPRELFFFREGSVVFWNMPESERSSVLTFMHRHQSDSYDMNLVEQEFEHADFTFTEKRTDLVGDEIHLKSPNNGNSESVEAELDIQEELERHTLEKYTFSNALALSVKLAIWEESLAKYVDSIEWILDEMKAGKTLSMERVEVLRKSGELLTLRHLINLSSDLLDTPDFYWDREELEKLYLRTCNYFNINRRTEVMNKKINYCTELTELLTDHLNDRHHTRLEWMIILLITIEVGFEILHSVERYWTSPEPKE